MTAAATQHVAVGRGCYAWSLRNENGDVVVQGSSEPRGSETVTTTNRMFLCAAIDGLMVARSYRTEHIEVFAQLGYLVNGMRHWVREWVNNGWMTANQTPVRNRELWERLLAAESRLDAVTWIEVTDASDPAMLSCVMLTDERLHRREAGNSPQEWGVFSTGPAGRVIDRVRYDRGRGPVAADPPKPDVPLIVAPTRRRIVIED